MTTWIKRPETIHTTHYNLVFDRGEGSSYSFDCDEFSAPLNSAEQSYLAEIRTEGLPESIERRESFHHDYGIVACMNCGQPVEMSSTWENQCTCGELYNGFGQNLAPCCLFYT
ncbi:MAG: hypothetical protein H0T53_11650 [Herpetosiphonaceae bacterium]|nr:hypothetical protein [Herpetosiphonaceae bacterium]